MVKEVWKVRSITRHRTVFVVVVVRVQWAIDMQQTCMSQCWVFPKRCVIYKIKQFSFDKELVSECLIGGVLDTDWYCRVTGSNMHDMWDRLWHDSGCRSCCVKVWEAMIWKVSRYWGLTIPMNVKELEWLTAKQCILDK